MKIALPKIYPITDRTLSALSHTLQVKEFAAGGATFVQIRDKAASSRDLYEEVSASALYARANQLTIIVNDRVDIALMTGADGVHLGQDDIPVSAARSLLGEDAIIGISTHTLEQAQKAFAEGIANYIAFGPIFPTSTKSDHEPVVGLETLRKVRETIGSFPLVAIGGINSTNVADVLATGADSAAMISEFHRSNESIEQQYRNLALALKAQ